MIKLLVALVVFTHFANAAYIADLNKLNSGRPTQPYLKALEMQLDPSGKTYLVKIDMDFTANNPKLTASFSYRLFLEKMGATTAYTEKLEIKTSPDLQAEIAKFSGDPKILDTINKIRFNRVFSLKPSFIHKIVSQLNSFSQTNSLGALLPILIVYSEILKIGSQYIDFPMGPPLDHVQKFSQIAHEDYLTRGITSQIQLLEALQQNIGTQATFRFKHNKPWAGLFFNPNWTQVPEIEISGNGITDITIIQTQTDHDPSGYTWANLMQSAQKIEQKLMVLEDKSIKSSPQEMFELFDMLLAHGHDFHGLTRPDTICGLLLKKQQP